METQDTVSDINVRDTVVKSDVEMRRLVMEIGKTKGPVI